MPFVIAELCVANTGAAVTITDTVTSEVIQPLMADCNPVGVAIAPDGHKAYIAHQASTNASVVDTTTNAIACFATGGYHNGIAISPDGGRIYLTDSAYTHVNSPSVSLPAPLRATSRLLMADRSLDQLPFNCDK